MHDVSTPFGDPQFLVLAGSRLYGIDTPDSDYDYVGALVEPIAYRVGLARYQPTGSDSQHGFEQCLVKGEDHEGSVYSLWKLANMLADGNPTILCLMFAKPIKDQFGICKGSFRQMVVNRRSGFRFLKYMQSQRKSMEGQRSKHVVRQELIDTHGYDTKFAGHVVRLGLQGIEFLNTGHVELPMAPEARAEVMAIRQGEVTQAEVIARSEFLEAEMLKAMDTTTLPEAPNMQALNGWLVRRYKRSWHLT